MATIIFRCHDRTESFRRSLTKSLKDKSLNVFYTGTNVTVKGSLEDMRVAKLVFQAAVRHIT